MQRTVWICDHCGKKLTDDNGWIGRDIDLPLIEWDDVDLCDDCMKELCESTRIFLKDSRPSYRDPEYFDCEGGNDE